MSEAFGPEAALRRALHAAAEQVEPGDDGLEKIRARVSHRRPMPLPVAWVDIALTRLALRVPDGFWTIWDRMAHEVRAVVEHFLPERIRSDRLRLGWLRPVAAMGTAVFIVAAVVYMAVEVPQVIAPAGSEATQLHNGGSGQHAGGGTGPGGQPYTQPGSKPTSFPGPSLGAPNASACPSRKTSPRGTITSSPPASSSPSPTPSPTTTSPSSSSSPSPSPSDTDSSAPTGSGTSPSGAADPGNSAADAARGGQTLTRAESLLQAAAGARAQTATTSPSPSPCPSSKPSPTSTVKVHPDAAGGLVLWAQGAGLGPADIPAGLG